MTITTTELKSNLGKYLDYVGYMLNSNLIFEIKNYYASFVDKESTPKYYFMDNGILNLFIIDKESRLLENAVATYLKRKEKDFYYLKNKKTGIDIDFYIPKDNKLVQVAYSIEDINTKSREVNALIKWKDLDSKLIIVTYNEKKTITIDNKTIEIIPLHEFLLTK